jgi:hypothetical protein
MSMLTDGVTVAGHGGQIQVMDLAEVVSCAIDEA